MVKRSVLIAGGCASIVITAVLIGLIIHFSKKPQGAPSPYTTYGRITFFPIHLQSLGGTPIVYPLQVTVDPIRFGVSNGDTVTIPSFTFTVNSSPTIPIVKEFTYPGRRSFIVSGSMLSVRSSDRVAIVAQAETASTNNGTPSLRTVFAGCKVVSNGTGTASTPFISQ